MSVNLLALAESLLQQESDVLDISQGAFPFPSLWETTDISV